MSWGRLKDQRSLGRLDPISLTVNPVVSCLEEKTLELSVESDSDFGFCAQQCSTKRGNTNTDWSPGSNLTNRQAAVRGRLDPEKYWTGIYVRKTME